MKKAKRSKPVDIDELATMVQRGFDGITSDLENFRLEARQNFATKQDVEEAKVESRGKFAALDRRLDAMADSNRRIARLERVVSHLTKE